MSEWFYRLTPIFLILLGMVIGGIAIIYNLIHYLVAFSVLLVVGIVLSNEFKKDA